ncbi:hypothetical protein EV182_003548 [Spiromyces aspiralis]|uniref:Uncharacterized protein n=1 Tax=Spiromyces aspiralis TaxID=68401 RepID=A0ACC1HTW9_9FUNG|nr:hypothetical protein EV182_003548 [Spiromyces aspiralis]
MADSIADRIGHGVLSPLQASLLVVNTAIGSGIFGLPWALKEAGLLVGIAIMLLLALLNLFAHHALIDCGLLAKKYRFEDMSHFALGRTGDVLLNFALTINGLGCCISYLLIIGDTITPVAQTVLGADAWWSTRNVVIIGFAVVVIFPLLFFKTIAPLSKPSALSIVCIPIIMLVVGIKGLEQRATAPPSAGNDDGIVMIGRGVLSAIGIIAFSFGSTQTTFSTFASLAEPTIQRWGVTATIATLTILIIYLSFSILGYLCFGTLVQSNILNNFASDDAWANFARILMAVSILLTYPMQFYPLRDFINDLLGQRIGRGFAETAKCYCTSLVLFCITIQVSTVVTDLGFVYQLVGTCASALLSFLLPSAIYLATHLEWWSYVRRLVTAAGRVQPAEVTPVLEQQSAQDLMDDEIAKVPDTAWRQIALSVFTLIFGLVMCTIGTSVILINRLSK